ncbi:MAG: twin-arginine translocase TatA/TatE family subunit [Bacteroidales bacterium]|nr:twin-arginine translocase TatA/TatE family subunit [Bacteroidales bacterium]MBQ7818705.1 twin-arginine translocase TatA/TatE family subunit [Bacteroidales bacterium]
MMLLMIGATEIIFIVALVILLFGGKKIPELMKGLGQGVKSFKEGMKEESKSNNSCDNDRENDYTENADK